MRDTLKMVFAVVGGAALVTGCGRKPVETAPQPIAHTSQPSTPPTAAATPVATFPTSTSTAVQLKALEERILFGFDQSSLSPQAQSILTAKADVLRTMPAVTLRIEGHADERGSDEYNLALSNRRAAEAKRFLQQQGVEASRLEAVGYGEERPAATGSDEQAWAANRRDDFRVTAGLNSR